MIVHAAAQRVLAFVMRQGARPVFPLLLGGFAFVATITQTVPVEWLVVVGALTSGRRWMSVAFCAATGSALAALGLYLAFHHFGWSVLAERYPELTTSRAWVQGTDWLSQYGSVTLFGLMALPLPIPKLPTLAMAGIYRLPIPEVALAIWLGKIVKYFAYAYVATRFPNALRRPVPATRLNS